MAVKLRAKFDAGDVQAVVNALRATEKQAGTARYRALKKTLRTVIADTARQLSAASDLPVGMFKRSAKNPKGYRIRQSRLGFDSTGASIWIGTNPVKAGYIGRARATRRGVSVGSGRFRRFYEHEDGYPVRLVERAGRASSILFLNKNRRWESIREPVVDTPIRSIEGGAGRLLRANFNRELNYILRFARTRYQATGRR